MPLRQRTPHYANTASPAAIADDLRATRWRSVTAVEVVLVLSLVLHYLWGPEARYRLREAVIFPHSPRDENPRWTLPGPRSTRRIPGGDPRGGTVVGDGTLGTTRWSESVARAT
jgi:hypothetical protein